MTLQTSEVKQLSPWCRATDLCVVGSHTDDDAERRWEGSEDEGRGFTVKARA